MNIAPPSTEPMDTIHSTGTVTPVHAHQLREFIVSLDDKTYLINETLLLLEATGHAKPDSMETTSQ